MGFQLQNAMPSCLYGHTATYDPDTKRIYIFGGIREDKDYSSIYILDTVTWKWLLVAVSTEALPTQKHRTGDRSCLNVAIDLPVSWLQQSWSTVTVGCLSCLVGTYIFKKAMLKGQKLSRNQRLCLQWMKVQKMVSAECCVWPRLGVGGTVQAAEGNGLSFYMMLLGAAPDAEVKSWSSQIRGCSDHRRSQSSLDAYNVLAEGPVCKGLSASFLAKSQDVFYRISLDEIFPFSVIFWGSWGRRLTSFSHQNILVLQSTQRMCCLPVWQTSV